MDVKRFTWVFFLRAGKKPKFGMNFFLILNEFFPPLLTSLLFDIQVGKRCMSDTNYVPKRKNKTLGISFIFGAYRHFSLKVLNSKISTVKIDWGKKNFFWTLFCLWKLNKWIYFLRFKTKSLTVTRSSNKCGKPFRKQKKKNVKNFCWKKKKLSYK